MIEVPIRVDTVVIPRARGLIVGAGGTLVAGRGPRQTRQGEDAMMDI
jgi:hypothetical protein